LTPVTIPLTADFDVDCARLVHARAKVTYLCSPNNPTSTALSRTAVEYVVDRAAGIVVIDGAYGEFATESFIDLLERSDRVVLTRTMSKAFGLAGARVGFGVGSLEAVRLIERARGPYKVNAVAERAALAVLEDVPDGLQWVRSHVALAVENRVRLDLALRELGLAPLASAANFLLVPTVRAAELGELLKTRGVLVRSFANLGVDVPALANSRGAALRIGVGPWPMLQSLLDVLAPELA
jgi:histidinol-phosphate/aromatic aminotransferase/cobyric acid decarboxylase-like protein